MCRVLCFFFFHLLRSPWLFLPWQISLRQKLAILSPIFPSNFTWFNKHLINIFSYSFASRFVLPSSFLRRSRASVYFYYRRFESLAVKPASSSDRTIRSFDRNNIPANFRGTDIFPRRLKKTSIRKSSQFVFRHSRQKIISIFPYEESSPDLDEKTMKISIRIAMSFS